MPTFDVQAPLMSLAGILKTSLATIPADVPYIIPDPNKVEQWRRELGGSGALNIGVCWQGNPEHPEDRRRSFHWSGST